MFLVFLIKNMCLMAFYFSYATMLFVQPLHKSMIVVYFITLFCFSLSYAFRFNEKYSKLKYLPILGVLVAMLYLKTITGTIAVMFPFIYMILIIKKDEYYVDYNTFKELFEKLIIATLVLILVVFILNWFDLFKSVSLVYVIVFIISGLYLLRTTRHSKDVITSKIFAVMNISVIVAACIICMILSCDITINAIIYVFQLIYNKIFVPALIGVSYALMGIAWIFMKFVSLFFNKNDVTMPMENILVAEDADNFVKSYGNNETYFFILHIFAYVLIAIICIYLLKKFLSKKNRKLDDEVEGIIQYRSFLKDNSKVNKKSKQIFKNSTNQIRYRYRKFLVLCYRRNMDVGLFDSSQSIYEKSCDVFVNSKEELESIREIYRKARYSKENIDSQDVKRFKIIYKKLENDKNSKNK